MMDYTVAGLSIQLAALREQLARVRPSDSFSQMLLLGKIKSIYRQLDEGRRLRGK
jgi:hypothetical protein